MGVREYMLCFRASSFTAGCDVAPPFWVTFHGPPHNARPVRESYGIALLFCALVVPSGGLERQGLGSLLTYGQDPGYLSLEDEVLWGMPSAIVSFHAL